MAVVAGFSRRRVVRLRINYISDIFLTLILKLVKIYQAFSLCDCSNDVEPVGKFISVENGFRRHFYRG